MREMQFLDEFGYRLADDKRMRPMARLFFGIYVQYRRSWEYLGYLFAPAHDPGYTSFFRRLCCRFKGHPCGCWYYNAYGLEPDYHCKDCGDEL